MLDASPSINTNYEIELQCKHFSETMTDIFGYFLPY